MKTPLIVLATALFTLNAHAGQESVGTSYCSAAQIECSTKGDPAREGAMVVCLFGDEDAHAYVGIEKNGTSERHDFNVKKVAVPPHMVGAGITYVGQGLSLKVNTDVAPRPEGIYSLVSIEDLGIRNQELFCRLKN